VRYQRAKARIERRLNVVWGFTRCRSPRDIPARFLVRIGNDTDGLVKFEMGTPNRLVYADWGVWPRSERTTDDVHAAR
jgi:hypothetical protein